MAEYARIKALPDAVIGQIAAGEVVEGPAAAVKELVENSLDASATAVTVDVREGGTAQIRVSDNGSGIEPADMRMAFARHATSKLRTAEELTGVQTLGFRGEALASIAAVARVTLVSRRRGAEEGVQAVCEGGDVRDIRPAACPEGTTITVRDLFFNAPVRRKFLKKPQTEAGYVGDLMARLILSRPDISFRFVADGKNVYFSPGDGLETSAVMSVYGMDTAKTLKDIKGQGAGLLLTGLLGVGDASRANRSHQHFFLNGRAIKSALLSGAVEAACRQRVTVGRFPMCVLHLQMPYELVDVNVHPNKWEVRFRDESAVAGAVTGIVEDALREDSPLSAPPPLFRAEDAPKEQPPALPPVISRTTPQTFRETARALPPQPVREVVAPPVPPAPKPVSQGNVGDDAHIVPPERSVVQRDEPVQTEAPPVQRQFSLPEVRILGVAFDTYILLECAQTLYLCDQHAAHERILFDRLMRATEAGGASQMLLAPSVISLSHREALTLSEHAAALERAGFDVTEFGQGAARLNAVPMCLGQPQAESCLRDALDQLAQTSQLSQQARTEKVMQIACKHAVKAGERLPDDEIKALVWKMLEDNVTPTCPHGRPLLIAVTRRELDKRFRRIQN